MELTEVVPVNISLLPHVKTETLYSFYLPLPFGYDTAFDTQMGYSKFVAWRTYIYSPCKQSINAGCLYEKLWVNGKPSSPGIEDPFRPVRFNTVLELEEGWNFLFGQADISQDIYECYLALPDGRGLVLSADKDMNGGVWFYHTPILPVERDAEIRNLKLPWPEDFSFGEWLAAENGAESPCREASWDSYGPSAQRIHVKESGDFAVKKDLHPDGFTMIYDMMHMRLLFPFLKLSGVKGASVDLLYGDRFMDDGQHIRSLSWVPLGDRISRLGDDMWFPIQPHFDADSGFDVTVDVKPGTLTWARGSFPHPKGLIEIAWHKENKNVIIDRMTAPEGVNIKIKES
jgi:hypothetical protein